MKHEKIWHKVLSADEKVEFEFSVGDAYRRVWLIVWTVISALLLFLGGMGFVVFLIALFYYVFYLKVANAYAFTNKRVLIHRGWLSTSMISVDYQKITDISVQEHFFERIITRTGNLAINTAGTTFHEVVLLHIDAPYEAKKQLDSLRDGK